MKAKLEDCYCTSARARSVVTIVIIDASRLGLHAGESITVHNCLRYKDITRYECGGGWNDVTACRDRGRLQFEASNSGLETSDYGRLQSSKIFGTEGGCNTPIFKILINALIFDYKIIPNSQSL